MAMIERICTHCGKTIQVPEELETFSCVYCGETMTLPREPVPVPESNEADHLAALEHLLDGIRDNPKYFMKNFNKKNYENSFYDYYHWREDTYRAMDRYLVANPSRREELLNDYVNRFLEDWESLRRERRGESAAFADKMTLALYEVPAILLMELNYGKDYVDLLNEKFVAKYPKNIWKPATYDDLASGFRRRKWCFITTAICEFEGKGDDCAELTAFRDFRDGWLTAHGDTALIEEYYDVAPAIVNAIEFCDDRAERYQTLRRDYLAPCYRALRAGDNEACRTRYIRMVRDLKQCYGLQ